MKNKKEFCNCKCSFGDKSNVILSDIFFTINAPCCVQCYWTPIKRCFSIYGESLWNIRLPVAVDLSIIQEKNYKNCTTGKTHAGIITSLMVNIVWRIQILQIRAGFYEWEYPTSGLSLVGGGAGGIPLSRLCLPPSQPCPPSTKLSRKIAFCSWTIAQC